MWVALLNARHAPLSLQVGFEDLVFHETIGKGSSQVRAVQEYGVAECSSLVCRGEGPAASCCKPASACSDVWIHYREV